VALRKASFGLLGIAATAGCALPPNGLLGDGLPSSERVGSIPKVAANSAALARTR